MNIYRYKNCLKFNIWNCTIPQIDGHAICIFNIISQEFRLFKFGTWGGLTWITETPLVEITDITDEIREYIKKTIKSRIRSNSNDICPTGTWDIVKEVEQYQNLRKWEHYEKDGLLDSYLNMFYFLHDNYVGDRSEEEVNILDYYDTWTSYCLKNLNPKIVCTK